MQELARSNEELEQFAYITSHDLREPLRVVASYAQLLEKRYKGRLDESANKYIFYITDAIFRMNLLINDLLTYSRVGKGTLNLEKVDLNECIKRVNILLKVQIQEIQPMIQCESLPILWASRIQMDQLFQNLIENGIKFHRPGERPIIRINACKKGDEWIISVSDNGIGIEEKYLERIFEIFQRLHPKAEYPGTGIGLAICKKIVDRHRGKIWAKSEFGKGSTFFISFPIQLDATLERPKLIE